MNLKIIAISLGRLFLYLDKKERAIEILTNSNKRNSNSTVQTILLHNGLFILYLSNYLIENKRHEELFQLYENYSKSMERQINQQAISFYINLANKVSRNLFQQVGLTL